MCGHFLQLYKQVQGSVNCAIIERAEKDVRSWCAVSLQ